MCMDASASSGKERKLPLAGYVTRPAQVGAAVQRGPNRDMPETVTPQDAAHCLQRVLGRVVLLAQVRKPDRCWRTIATADDRFGSRGVGQVPIGSSHALFEEVRIRPRVQQV